MAKEPKAVAKQDEADAPEEKKELKKLKQFEKLNVKVDIINFKDRTLVRKSDGFYHPLTSDIFARLAYAQFAAMSVTQIRELEHMFRAVAPDRTEGYSHIINFGGQVWDMTRLAFRDDIDPASTVYSSPITPQPAHRDAAFAYITELAQGDEDLAWDMVQAMAPLLMTRKPAGVIWFVGGGANGKSALVNAIYKIIGHHLTSLTVAAIEDGKSTPNLNGVLGNVCRESSEGKVEDSERYKAIGTHEPFTIRKFHSQDNIVVAGDVHHIFNANNIPIFSDKTEGARRRTLIIPFNNKFKPDPTYEDRVFTKDFLGGLLSLIIEGTALIAENNYQYAWSQKTRRAKEEYDSEVNSAEAFLEHLRQNKVRCFSNFNMLRMAYENWCANEGLIPLGITNLRRVMKNMAHAERLSVRNDQDVVVKRYFIDGHKAEDKLISLPNGLHVEEFEEKAPSEEVISKEEMQQTLGKDW